MSASSAHPGLGTRHHRTALEITALAAGGVFALVGILGFIPGVTTNYSEMGLAGPDSGAMLLGVFQVSVLHNIVHLLFGAAGLLMGRTVSQARYFLIGGGALYLVLWLYGLLIDQGSAANFVPINTADNWLHAVLGIAMVALGFFLGRGTERTRPNAM
ncbi:MAG TPA: DUF4383 domain-containing protein [Arthrobacter sp.]|nr:DUF4383 domain-containing protein [Arthrobacter sp.]